MKAKYLLILAAPMLGLSGPLLAQVGHHAAPAQAQAQAMRPEARPTADELAPQCAALMPMMTQLMEMMQGGVMQGELMGADSPVMSETDASTAYGAAVTMMAAPMMEATQNAQPDAGFVQALIAQRNGSVALAEAVLRYGADDQVKTWANEVLAAAPADIARWQAWLDSQPN